MATLVLSVGQCGFDNSRLSRLLHDSLNATMDTAYSADDARRKMGEKKYDIVLINRIFDGDGSSGIEFIGELKQEADAPPLMLISDYPEAQQAALANGAVPGFGKSSLSSPDASILLKRALRNPVTKS
jgi:DNA-binding NtrC family response regulator